MNGTGILIATVVVQVLVGLAILYLTERVKHSARGAVDAAVGKALAEHGHELKKRLETLRLDHARIAQDFGLFASKRNDVYAGIYAAFSKSVGWLHSVVGVTTMPDFTTAEPEAVSDYLTNEAKITTARKESVLELWTRDREAGGRELYQIETERRREEANEAFNEAKNAAALNELYLSPEVARTVDAAIKAIARVLVLLWPGQDSRHMDQLEARISAEGALRDLKFEMQSELRRGMAPAPAPQAVATGPSVASE